jgi:RNA polymerase sigma-70 factor (ECF subfamily)
MTDNTESINRLLDQWQAGINREENFRRLFERYYGPVYRFFEKRNFLLEECQDLTQETFFCIYIGIATFRQEARFETWLFQIAANVYRAARRRRSADKRAGQHVSWESMTEQEQAALGSCEREGLGSALGPLDEVLEEERRQVVRQAIEELPEQMRQCVLLQVYQELSYREIAGTLQLSVDTVRTHLSQARRQLKEKLADYFDELE